MILTPDLGYQLPLERMCPESKPRSQGLHLSDIIRDLDKRVFGNKYGDDPIDPTLARRGFVFERILARAFGEELESGELLDQVEIQSPEGVYMTLDGWLWRHPGKLREYKSTRKSSKKLVSVEGFQANFRTWDWQIQSYCKAAGVLECELYVLWLGTEYGYPGAQEPVRKYDLCYTPDELQETWRMLMNHAETMRREGLGGR